MKNKQECDRQEAINYILRTAAQLSPERRKKLIEAARELGGK